MTEFILHGLGNPFMSVNLSWLCSSLHVCSFFMALFIPTCLFILHGFVHPYLSFHPSWLCSSLHVFNPIWLYILHGFILNGFHSTWLRYSFLLAGPVSVLPSCSVGLMVDMLFILCVFHPTRLRCSFLLAGPVSVLLPCSIGIPGIFRPLCKLSDTHHLMRGWEDYGQPLEISWTSSGQEQQLPHPSSALSGFGWLGQEAEVTSLTAFSGYQAFVFEDEDATVLGWFKDTCAAHPSWLYWVDCKYRHYCDLILWKSCRYQRQLNCVSTVRACLFLREVNL